MIYDHEDHSFLQIATAFHLQMEFFVPKRNVPDHVEKMERSDPVDRKGRNIPSPGKSIYQHLTNSIRRLFSMRSQQIEEGNSMGQQGNHAPSIHSAGRVWDQESMGRVSALHKSVPKGFEVCEGEKSPERIAAVGSPRPRIK